MTETRTDTVVVSQCGHVTSCCLATELLVPITILKSICTGIATWQPFVLAGALQLGNIFGMDFNFVHLKVF